MTEVEKQINELVNTSGKNAAVMNTALKSIGDDSMQDGLRRMANYFQKSGYVAGTQKGIKVGEKSGAVKGSLATLVVVATIAGGKYVYDVIKMKKEIKQLDQENEKEGKEILKALRNNLPCQNEVEKRENEWAYSK